MHTTSPSPHEPALLVIYTGGTFGMHETSRGLAPDPGFPAELTAMLGEISRSRIEGTRGFRPIQVILDPAIDSSDATPGTMLQIAVSIRQAMTDPQHSPLAGAVVIHGTDTLAYTAARLAFELHDLDMPVVLTGSQLPYGAPRSDAAQNLALACTAALNGQPGAWVAFDGELLPAVRATKRSSTEPRAFAAALPLAAHASTALLTTASNLTTASTDHRATPARVISFRFTPGVTAEDLRAAVGARPDGLILECYGAGNAPTSQRGMREVLVEISSSLPVVAVSQCDTGGVGLGTYAPGSDLADAGVLDGSDLTVEAATGKLAFLLDRHLDSALMTQNLIGECASRNGGLPDAPNKITPN